eukprot:8825106-Lingulodinium_polyedra.AAC.1
MVDAQGDETWDQGLVPFTDALMSQGCALQAAKGWRGRFGRGARLRTAAALAEAAGGGEEGQG